MKSMSGVIGTGKLGGVYDSVRKAFFF